MKTSTKTTPPRLEDWPGRLAAAVDAARGKVFDWKTHNCATFAADCVEAVTGHRYHEDFAVLHQTAASARVHSASAEKLRNMVCICLHTPITLPTLAQRGDVVLIELATAHGDMPSFHAAIGVCLGRQAVSLAPEGLVFVGMEMVSCAWRI